MELQEEMKWNCWQHWFILHKYAFKKCSQMLVVADWDMLHANGPALLSCWSTKATFFSRIIPFYNIYDICLLLNIEIHNF
jgi:hypothetical protein